jgi:hypothetical protein
MKRLFPLSRHRPDFHCRTVNSGTLSQSRMFLRKDKVSHVAPRENIESFKMWTFWIPGCWSTVFKILITDLSTGTGMEHPPFAQPLLLSVVVSNKRK